MNNIKKFLKVKQTKNNAVKVIVVIALINFGIISFGGCIGRTENSIKISGAFALYPMMNIWVENYQNIHPEIKIELSAGGAGKGMSDAINGIVDIGMVSREIYKAEIEQKIFWVSVAKDAVVATINTENPVISNILTTGLARQQFVDIFITKKITTWGQLVGNPSVTNPIRVYTRSDSCGAAETWAKYLGNYTQEDITNVASAAVNGDPNLAAAIQGDRYSIGFNNINFAYDSKTKKPFSGLKPVPIDLNEDGILGENETFYDTLDNIVNAIANDLYPSPPSRALYLVTKSSIKGIVKEFINWILTEGQQYVSLGGYIQLSEDTIDQQIEYLQQGKRPEMP